MQQATQGHYLKLMIAQISSVKTTFLKWALQMRIHTEEGLRCRWEIRTDKVSEGELLLSSFAVNQKKIKYFTNHCKRENTKLVYMKFHTSKKKKKINSSKRNLETNFHVSKTFTTYGETQRWMSEVSVGRINKLLL